MAAAVASLAAEARLWRQHEYSKTFFNSDVHMEGWRRYEVLGVIFFGDQ